VAFPLDVDSSAIEVALVPVGLAAVPCEVVRKYLCEASAQGSTGVGVPVSPLPLPSPQFPFTMLQITTGGLPVASDEGMQFPPTMLQAVNEPPSKGLVSTGSAGRTGKLTARAESIRPVPPRPIATTETTAAAAPVVELLALFLFPFATSDATTQQQVAAFQTIR